MSDGNQGRLRLAGVSIATDRGQDLRTLFQVLTGVEGETSDGLRIEFRFGGTTLALVRPEGSRVGLCRVTFASGDMGAGSEKSRFLTGIEAHVVADAGASENDGHDSAWLDHVALVVADLPEAVRRWSELLGTVPPSISPHPLGGSDAARFHLGRRMLELVSPWPASDTPTRRRLEAAGDGPIALALVQRDLQAAISRLQSLHIPLIDQPPHVFVHPKATGGVLVQLTPRVEH